MKQQSEGARLAELEYEEELLTNNRSVSMPGWQWKALGRLAHEKNQSRSELITATTLPLVEHLKPTGGLSS